MTPQPPPPPPIAPHQMTLLRVVTAMAWADGHLAQEEIDVMLDRFSHLFANSDEQRQKLAEELRDYMMQNIPLEELIPKLKSAQERELVLQLGYEVIASSARTPDEPNINEEEAEAYQKLVSLLGVSSDAVERIEREVNKGSSGDRQLVDKMVERLKSFIQG